MRRALPLLLAAACTVDPTGQPVPLEPMPAVQAAPPVLRRLTQRQLEHAVRDLFGPEVYVPADLEPELRLDGLVAVGTAEQAFSPRGVERFEQAAFIVAEQAVAPEHRGAFLACDPAAEACLRDTLAQVGRRAWRRPLTGAELDAVVDVAAEAAAVLDDPYEGLGFGLATLLQSPDFLLRPELGEPHAEGGRRYTGFELASRLSFLLWDSLPDDALLDAAADGTLDTTEGIDAEVQRMLADPRASDGLAAWATDLLLLDELAGIQKDASVLLHFDASFGASARGQTLATLDDHVFTLDADLRDLLTSRRTFLDRTLARIYDVRAPAREGFGLAELPEDGPRAGLLGHASLLSLASHPTASSATLRGKLVREVLLCQGMPPPPADVDTSIPEPSADAPTLRDRIKVHLESPTCAGCHAQTDPIGLGLEQFDALGGFRTHEGHAPIDPSGDLDGIAFDDAVGLGAAVREHPALVPCLVEQVVRYALGRAPTAAEAPAVDWLVDRFATYDHRLQPLWMELVTSPLFRQVGEVD